MKIGDIVNSKDYVKYAIWANKNNAHIEMINGQYTIVENAPVEPLPIDTTSTNEERIAILEAENESMNDLLLSVIDIIDAM